MDHRNNLFSFHDDQYHNNNQDSTTTTTTTLSTITSSSLHSTSSSSTTTTTTTLSEDHPFHHPKINNSDYYNENIKENHGNNEKHFLYLLELINKVNDNNGDVSDLVRSLVDIYLSYRTENEQLLKALADCYPRKGSPYSLSEYNQIISTLPPDVQESLRLSLKKISVSPSQKQQLQLHISQQEQQDLLKQQMEYFSKYQPNPRAYFAIDTTKKFPTRFIENKTLLPPPLLYLFSSTPFKLEDLSIQTTAFPSESFIIHSFQLQVTDQLAFIFKEMEIKCLKPSSTGTFVIEFKLYIKSELVHIFTTPPIIFIYDKPSTIHPYQRNVQNTDTRNLPAPPPQQQQQQQQQPQQSPPLSYPSIQNLDFNLELNLENDIDSLDSSGNTKIMASALDGDHSSFLKLLSYRPNLFLKNKVGQNIFYLSCSGGNLEIVKFLINNNVNFLERDHTGTTGLHIATEKKYKELIYYLSSNFIEMVRVQDNQGLNPLHYAIMNGDPQIVRIYIQVQYNHLRELEFAQLNDDYEYKDNDYDNDNFCQNYNHCHSKYSKSKQHWFLDDQDASGMSALHWGCALGHYDSCVLLLKAGLDINLRDNDYETCTFKAVRSKNNNVLDLIQNNLTANLQIENRLGMMVPVINNKKPIDDEPLNNQPNIQQDPNVNTQSINQQIKNGESATSTNNNESTTQNNTHPNINSIPNEILDEKHPIFLIGPTGCGKSTIINLLANYFYQGAREQLKVVIPSGQYQQNEMFDVKPTEIHGKGTSNCSLYSFSKDNGETFTFVDTPGIDIESDEEREINCQKIIDTVVKQRSLLSGIILLINGATKRISIEFKNAINSLRSKLPNIFEQALLVFTNCTDYDHDFDSNAIQDILGIKCQRYFCMNNTAFNSDTDYSSSNKDRDWASSIKTIQEICNTISNFKINDNITP
eukprot:gene10076-12352_t